MIVAQLWRRYALYVSLLLLVLGWILTVASAITVNVGTSFLGGLTMAGALAVIIREVRRS
jgi:hypothetical protein